MPKTILLFPGQGSQYLGMGKALAGASPAARARLDRAGAILGYDLADLMWNGPEDRLRQTQCTQPALFTVSMLVLDALRERGLGFDYAAGHSLGEYSALCAAGVFGFEDGLRLVKLPGELMSRAGEARPGAMAAVLGLEAGPLEAVLAQARSAGEVVMANHNSPSQIVISGAPAAVEEAGRLAQAAGAKKVVPLPVSGAFHSPFMAPAAAGLAQALAEVEFRAPSVPVITNVEAAPGSDPARLKALLVEQLTSPVRWVESMLKAVELGCGRGLEVGAGKVLMGLARGITRDLAVTPVETPEQVAAA